MFKILFVIVLIAFVVKSVDSTNASDVGKTVKKEVTAKNAEKVGNTLFTAIGSFVKGAREGYNEAAAQRVTSKELQQEMNNRVNADLKATKIRNHNRALREDKIMKDNEAKWVRH